MIITYSDYHQYIKILLVCPSVCDGYGRGRNEFAGHVQNNHVRYRFLMHRNDHIIFS